jgi:hypothetical protein
MSSPIAPIPTLIPTTYTIGHRVWSTGAKNINGNIKGTHAAAVPRPCQGFYQSGTQQPISAEYATRQAQEIIVMVPDGSIYSKRDEILIGGAAVDDHTYTGGRAFFFEGHVEGFLQGSPFPEINGAFGDLLHLKRVG